MQPQHPRHLEMYLPCVREKRGLEIGGPSELIFQENGVVPLYPLVENLDNCDFSKSTVWAEHAPSFVFNAARPPGKTIFSEGSALLDVADATYDFLLSSHNLEHFANPVKALKEWQRILKPDGALILVLPYYPVTFDHSRKPSSVSHMFEDFHRNVGEDDLTHLAEILAKHDLRMDPQAGSRQNFERRSRENFSNRCLHHHVFDEHNSRELLTRAGFRVMAVDLVRDIHICILAAK